MAAVMWRRNLQRLRFYPRFSAQTRLFVDRNLVSIAANERTSLGVEPSQDLKNNRDVPLLFLPYTVKKAYVVHESATYLPKAFDKYKWLTKTLSTPGLPEIYDKDSVVASEEIINVFHDALLQAVSFQKAYKNKNLPRYNTERVNYNIASNFIRIAMIANNAADHLNDTNSSLYHEPLLETHWPRNYKFYQTKFRPTFCIKTRHGHDLIEKPQELSQEQVESIPGPYDNYALNVYRQHIVHLLNRPAMDNSKYNPIKNCHTTLTVNTRIRSDEQFYALANFTSFAQLISQALDSGALHGTELKKPFVTQTIVTNGYKMVFMVYQLNTLYLSDDKGLWNRCWYSPVYDMYERKVDGPFTVFEDAERNKTLRGFNIDVCKYFLNFIGRETTL